MKIEIRPIHLTDAQQSADLLNEIIAAGTYTILQHPISLEEQETYLRQFPARGVFLVALDESQQLLGMQSIEPLSSHEPAWEHVGEISTFIRLKRRRLGIASRLFQAILHPAMEMGYRKLMATVRADNSSALAFYQSQGFRIIGTAQAHARLQDRYIDEILMEILLK